MTELSLNLFRKGCPVGPHNLLRVNLNNKAAVYCASLSVTNLPERRFRLLGFDPKKMDYFETFILIDQFNSAEGIRLQDL